MTTATKEYLEKSRIQFDDGRKGIQHVWVHANGDRELTEIVVTVNSDGTRTNQVYSQKEYLLDHVYGLSRLNGSAWSVIPGTVTRC